MPITINGSGSITGLSAGGLPANSVTAATIGSLPAGSVLQVQSTIKKDTQSQAVGSTHFWETDLKVTITPSAASSKILLLGQINAATDDDQALDLQLMRKIGSAAVATLDGANADTASNRALCHAQGLHSKTTWVGNIAINYLDSPNTTDAVQYSFRLHHGSGSARTMYLNRTHADADSNERARFTSVLTALEVAA